MRKTPLIEFLVLGWLALALVVLLYFWGLFEPGSSLQDFGPVSLNLPTILLAYFLFAFFYLGVRRMHDRGDLAVTPSLAPELKLLAYTMEHAPGNVDEGEAMDIHLQTIAEFARTLTEATGAVLEIVEGDLIAKGYATGDAAPHKWIRANAQAGLGGVCLQSGQPVNCPDMRKDPRGRQGPPLPAAADSTALAPIKHGARSMGFIRVFSTASYAFGPNHLEILKLLGIYAGASIWRAHDPATQKDLMAEYSASLVAAQEARARFEQLADNLRGVYMVTDLKREKLLYISPAYEKIWGRSLESLVNNPKSFTDPVHPDDKQRVEAAIAKHPEGGYEIDYRITLLDQSVRWIHERSFPVRNEAGKTVAVAILAEDVSDQRGAESELATIERRLERGLENGPAIFWAARPGGDYGLTFVSANVQQIVGHAATSFTDDPNFWSARLHPDDQTRVFEAFPKLFEKGTLVHEYRFQHKDGTYRLLRDDMKLIRNPDGDPVEIVGYWVDITERKRAEEGLAYSLNRIKELQESRTRLLNTIAHDLASPLTPIGLQLEILRMSLGQATDKQQKSLDIVTRNVAHLTRLIEDLKDLARLEAGQLKIDPKPTDLAEIVQKAIDTFHEPAKERGMRLDAKIAAPRIPIVADEQRITQVVFNFLTNALKFGPEQGTIHVEASVDAANATVRVRDEGRGLTREEIAKLFRPFSQIHDRAQMKEKGTGLGLFICKGLIEKHGGTIWAESQGHGKGATFAFTIPLKHDAAAPAKAQAPPKEDLETPAARARRTRA